MDVRFTTTTSDKLSTLQVTEGQIIALSDINGYYYDLGGARHTAAGTIKVETLPSTGQSGLIYIVIGDTASSYVWDDINSKFLPLTSASQVKSEECTYEEYQALTDEEKADGTVRYITDAVAGSESIINDNVATSGTTYSSKYISSLYETQSAQISSNSEKLAQVESDIQSIDTEVSQVQTDIDTINDKLGTTDISSIGDGTVTGAIVTLNKGGDNIISILNNGFPTQTKTFSDDGTTITATSGDTDTLGWTLTKVFTDSFLTCTTTLKDAGENIKATLIKQFSADGKTISTVYNYEG